MFHTRFSSKLAQNALLFSAFKLSTLNTRFVVFQPTKSEHFGRQMSEINAITTNLNRTHIFIHTHIFFVEMSRNMGRIVFLFFSCGTQALEPCTGSLVFASSHCLKELDGFLTQNEQRNARNMSVPCTIIHNVIKGYITIR